MKKALFLLCSVFILCTYVTTPVMAENPAYSWYCKHEKNHVQPKAASEFSFISEMNAYYMDLTKAEDTEENKVIYLTFDAGYENGNVAKILDVLKEEQVPAAFFIVNTMIEKNPEVVQRMFCDGHTVCNHTVHHCDMSRLEDDAFMAEIQGLEENCREKLELQIAKYYRPPEGRFSEKNLQCAKKNGYKTIFWSFAYPDWDNTKQPALEKAKQIILDNAHNGEVMLLHPNSATNAAILKDVICSLKSAGYRFGTLDELVENMERIR